MAEFTANSQSFRTSLPFPEIDPNMDLVNQFHGFNGPVMENPCLNFHNLFSVSNTNLYCHQQAPDFPGNLDENFLGIFNPSNQSSTQVSQSTFVTKDESQESRKRKSADVSESSSRNSPGVSDCGTKKKHSSGRGKRVKNNEKEEEKPKEVVHVRARRGQATDSHSLAERVRRQKINERLKCLQNIVPGCYKTMGMAVMLDEIINYVQSLQNQVEFVSMKLTTASSFYDFNSEMDPMIAMQGLMLQRAKSVDAKEVERLMTERQVGGLQGLQPQWPF